MAREKKKLAKQQAADRVKNLPLAGAGSPAKDAGRQDEPSNDWFKEKFRWSQRTIDVDFTGSWDWNLSPSEVRVVLSHLEEMSEKTWAEISQETVGKKGRAKSHPQSLSDIVPEARARLEQIQVEVEELYRVRLGYSERLWGYRSRGCFHVLWYDRDHAIYDD